jgi:DNA-directed RNA polymerase subunit L
MPVEVLAKGEGKLELMLRGEDIGFANLVVHELLKSKAVGFASAIYDHPMTGNPVIKILAKDPKKELEKALNSVKKQVGEFKSVLASER